ncbi:acyl-CoA dehydratase activase [candidate division CSSED10-310 bacterium]|uniref:Acyl-CoA dehydratase activase n=1 Tax=candidate division CSSED10-310 bacterium TaxID=2855610 RepID=A0ABV6Z332_UNCC1
MMNDQRKYFLGIDVGSLSCDGVLIDQDAQLIAWEVMPTGVSGTSAADKTFADLLVKSHLEKEQIIFTVATGYGRQRVTYANKSVTEITCHGRGAHYFFPETGIVVDIGGQDSKAIRIDEQGRVLDFVMNDRCAAGTGRFLEVMARALEIELIDLGPLSLKAKESCSISSICTVFAESEVVSLLANGKPVDYIARGLHEAVARRTMGLVQRVKPRPDDNFTISGGVAHNKGVVREVEELIGKKLNFPSNPQIVGAVGAALIAREFGTK